MCEGWSLLSARLQLAGMCPVLRRAWGFDNCFQARCIPGRAGAGGQEEGTYCHLCISAPSRCRGAITLPHGPPLLVCEHQEGKGHILLVSASPGLDTSSGPW